MNLLLDIEKAKYVSNFFLKRKPNMWAIFFKKKMPKYVSNLKQKKKSQICEDGLNFVELKQKAYSGYPLWII